MPIAETDLVFLESERLDDSPSGGGRMTGNVIPDGQENNLFPDIAPTDRVFGRVRLRKVYAANRSLDTDLYLGAHVIVSHPPADPDIAVTLFAPGSWTDVRDDARDYVERFLTRSGYWQAHLYGNHLVGQRALQLVNFIGAPLPVVGQTLTLIQDEGEETEQEQYVRITRVTATTQTFVDSQGSFERVIVLAEISDPLRYDFEGSEVSRYTAIDSRTRLRDTIASAAARYYSVRKLTAQAALSAREVTVDSLYTPLVPSVQTEIPIVDAQAGGGKDVAVSGGAREVSVPQVAHTQWIPILAANQALNYTALLLPKPAPSTLAVSYRAQGKWYTLSDNGSGGLTGSGAGTINYTTGSLLVTLLALPDINSSILLGWGSGVHTQQPTLTAASVAFPGWRYQLAHSGVLPNSVTLTWTSGGQVKTVVDDGQGRLKGDGGGKIDYGTGALYLMPTALPDPGATPVVAYQYGAAQTETFTPNPDGNRFATITVTEPPIEPRSVTVRWVTRRAKTESEKITKLVS